MAKAKDFEDKFFNGKRDNVPAVLRDNPVAIAFYNLTAEEFKDGLQVKANKMQIAADIALGIDEVVKSNVFENGKQVIDWQKNDDIKGRIKIGIDDLLFEMTNKYDLEISFEHFDNLISESIKIAEYKFKD